MANTLLTGLTLVTCVVILVRLIVFRRGECRYRPGIACLAWLLCACVGGYALAITCRIEQPSVFVLGILLVLMMLVLRARGNLASVVRVHWGLGWDGLDRRARR